MQPRAVASFGQQGGQTAGTIINNGPLERHLVKEQIERLDAIAETLPESATEWLVVEHTNDAKRATFAQEIYDIFSAKRRVNPGPVHRLTEPNPKLRGIWVTVASQIDAHFNYAQLIANALTRPDTQVHFEPPKDPKPGVVKIVILRQESTQPAVRSDKQY